MAVFPSIFVADTKIIYSYSFVAPLIVAVAMATVVAVADVVFEKIL